MQILVVDDEALARDRLKRLIEGLPNAEVVGEAENGKHAIEQVQTLDPELVLLDIRMPVMDGLECARALSEIDEPPAIVFCTAYEEHALEAFNTLAVGYLVKPVQVEDLQSVIDRARKTNKAQRASRVANEPEGRRHISARTRKGLELIALENIHCFIADHKYVTIYHEEGETLIDETLKDLENEFGARFVRVHRNALVAVNQISALEKDSNGHSALKLRDSDFTPTISRRHLAGVRELLGKL
jgi:two-component system response regulator AlgR